MQLKTIWAAMAFTCLSAACVSASSQQAVLVEAQVSDETTAIANVLKDQQAAWNDGNIDGFMDGYWKSEELRFASGGTVTRGWQATRDRYHARYDDRAKMGKLTFSDLEINPISEDAAVVHGGWALQRAADRPSGLFTLVLRKFGDNWRVVSDTTTSAD